MNDVRPEDGAHIPPASGGTYPLRAGNAIEPLIDGEPAFRRICEAVEKAQHSVWVTVAYYEHAVRMPDERGSFFDVLDRAAAKGIDVRVIFWREPRLPEVEPGSSHFSGSADQLRWLEQRGSKLLARFDRLPNAYCQHQKSWLVDAGEVSEVAFVGGINLDRASISAPRHAPRDTLHVHDLYVEIRGPAATDVHHNFVQRWNEASERGLLDGEWPSAAAAAALEFPKFTSRPVGSIAAQVTRTIMPNRYMDETATPDAKPLRIVDGEHSVFEQYIAALDAAERCIYIENQAIASPEIVDALYSALERGIEVVFLVPGEAHPAFVEARKNPRAQPFFERLGRLGQFDHFTLAAIASQRGTGEYQEIYVHAKIAIVDDCWATIGSTNVAARSFRRDSELNVSFWHEGVARRLREALLLEHLDRDTSLLGGRAALALFRAVARENRDRKGCAEPLEGLAYALDPNEYGH
ncbi:MAG: phosphatidylserine/phosphatidylglycerophosphate/cardiolipin synthase family protein [Myxococcales bacterium]|nr:phosphatidylserine/phosphatidylglycerophosphate/cardiolipin synthase family protein [Myxococcales bacterium]